MLFCFALQTEFVALSTWIGLWIVRVHLQRLQRDSPICCQLSSKLNPLNINFWINEWQKELKRVCNKTKKSRCFMDMQGKLEKPCSKRTKKVMKPSIVCTLTFDSKKLAAPLTPTCPTSISVSAARRHSPESSGSSPAAALRNTNRNWAIYQTNVI